MQHAHASGMMDGEEGPSPSSCNPITFFLVQSDSSDSDLD